MQRSPAESAMRSLFGWLKWGDRTGCSCTSRRIWGAWWLWGLLEVQSWSRLAFISLGLLAASATGESLHIESLDLSTDSSSTIIIIIIMILVLRMGDAGRLLILQPVCDAVLNTSLMHRHRDADSAFTGAAIMSMSMAGIGIWDGDCLGVKILNL